MDKNTRKKNTRIFAIISALIGGVIICSTYTFSKSFIQYDVGPDVYPRLLSILVVLLCLFLIIKPGEGREKNNTEEKNKTEEKSDAEGKIFSLKLFFYLALMVACVLLSDVLGFILSAIIVFMTMMWIMGERRILRMVIISSVFCVIVYLLVSELLSVPLPLGILDFIF